VLIIKHLCGDDFKITNLSNADDTSLLASAINDNGGTQSAGLGGTTVRFLLALAALEGGGIVITGEPALQARPIADLVDALNSLGADIQYIDKKGHLPVKVKGKITTGKEIAIDASVSSQFVSALMLIAPALSGGLTIKLKGEVASQSYIEMTRIVMRDFGVETKFEDGVIAIPETTYAARDYYIETDWSAASYWYEIAALAESANIYLPGLVDSPLQGDRKIIDIMESLGVGTVFENTGVRIIKQQHDVNDIILNSNLSNSPDLGPALIATAAGLGITADFTGLKNFRLKECDRASALQRELYKFRVRTDFCGGSKFKVYSHDKLMPVDTMINTYHDHRIAMALAPLSLKSGTVLLDDFSVVSKSYPQYWDHLKEAGFEVKIDNT
jgi:3-phosphoshikimate 1-carboxyvinyltransferase